MLSFLRFFSVTTISMLLLSPFLRLSQETVQNPMIVIGQDNSSSVADAMSSEDSAKYRLAIKQMTTALEKKYDVHVLTFGDTPVERDTFAFDEKVTDIAAFLDYTREQYADQNLGAIVVATDGLYNRGKNPLYLNRKSTAPVFAIALGDTTVKTDMVVTRVLHNKIAFLGDKFPVQIDLAARKLNTRTGTLRVDRIEGGQRIPVDQRNFRIDSDDFFLTEEIYIEAVKPGVTRYRASVSGVSGEASYANNSKDFYIEIIDGRVRILILANAPHPDVAAIRSVLDEQENYSADFSLYRDFKGQARDYDLVILHQLPSIQYDITPLLRELDAKQTPRLYIVGGQTSLGRFNQLQSHLQIQTGQQAANEVTAVADETFSLFTVPQNLNAQISKFAPLQSPYGRYTTDPAARVYLYQRIGKVETQFPLLMFGETAGVKTGILAAEGFWRWRLYDYLQQGTHELTHTLMSKTIQYLTVKEDKRRFRAAPGSNIFQDNETVTFDAEFYNRSYERVTDPDVFLEVRDIDQNSYRYTFSKSATAYDLSLGKFPPGDYQYTAYTDFDGQRHQVDGRFSVQQTELENYATTADHRLLQSLTSQSGGSVSYPGDLSALTETLLSHQQIKPVLYQSVINKPLIHMRWLFFVFLACLGLEWFVRRYLGGY
jgi:hypothetical protein